ncbi:TPA: hypothetical protein IAA82_00390, partial [Candidatus Galligastranaerophilus gallistercoris]|nr:hypothetical protein [Candidatus Galligastranaerophilus gallistercoris]
HFKIGTNILRAVINDEIQNKEKQTFYFKKENLMFFDFFTKNIIK